MVRHRAVSSLFLFLLAAQLVLGSSPMLAAGQLNAVPHAKVIPFRSVAAGEQPLLAGPPESVTMRSGLVSLAPGASVGKHSTGQHEELLVVLGGKGQMTFAGGATLPVQAGSALYCPPQTEHNVTNTGTGLLRYVYVVASTPPAGAVIRP